MGNEQRLAHPGGSQKAVKAVAVLAIELSNAMIEHDAILLQLVRDAYRLAGVNVKVEMR